MGIKKEQHEANIKEFEILASQVQRKGMGKLIDYIRKSDFYEAPASTKFHLACEGGLLQHSLNVYHCLHDKLVYNPLWNGTCGNVSVESSIVVALFHDIYKTYFYDVSTRNVKNEQTGKWEKVPYYTINDKMPLGHGEKSAFILQKFIQITDEEFYAIRWHMGFTEPKDNYASVGAAMEKYPLVLALHQADLEASKIMEAEGGNRIRPAAQPAADYADQPVFLEAASL